MAEGDNELPRMLKPQQLRGLPTGAPEFAPPSTRAMLSAIENEITRKPLDEIAGRLSKLNYGEMKELSQGIKAEPDAIWDWAITRLSEEMKR